LRLLQPMTLSSGSNKPTVFQTSNRFFLNLAHSCVLGTGTNFQRQLMPWAQYNGNNTTASLAQNVWSNYMCPCRYANDIESCRHLIREPAVCMSVCNANNGVRESMWNGGKITYFVAAASRAEYRKRAQIWAFWVPLNL